VIVTNAKATIVSGLNSPWAKTASNGTNTTRRIPISRSESPANSEMLRKHYFSASCIAVGRAQKMPSVMA
jgi:hypothetical protein